MISILLLIFVTLGLKKIYSVFCSSFSSVLFRIIRFTFFCMVTLSFSLDDISASVIAIFCFFFYVICCICSTVFGTFKPFLFIKMSCKVLTVIDATNFDISTWVLESGKLQCFSNSVVSVCDFFCPKRTPRDVFLFLLGKCQLLLFSLIRLSKLNLSELV